MLAGLSATITNTVLSFTPRLNEKGKYDPDWLAYELFDKEVADEIVKLVCHHHETINLAAALLLVYMIFFWHRKKAMVIVESTKPNCG
jgi:hypothetical protein